MISIWTLLVPTPQIFIQTKYWFPIIRVDPPYPNSATDNSFRNPWQSIRNQSIRYPLYLSTVLYRVVCKHKRPQNCSIQQRNLPIQVPERQLITKSTQNGLVLCYWVGKNSSPLPHYRALSGRVGGKNLFVKWRTWSSRVRKLRKRRPKKINPWIVQKVSTINNCRIINGIRIPCSTGIPWSRYPPDISLSSSLASHRPKLWHIPDLNPPGVKRGGWCQYFPWNTSYDGLPSLKQNPNKQYILSPIDADSIPCLSSQGSE